APGLVDLALALVKEDVVVPAIAGHLAERGPPARDVAPVLLGVVGLREPASHSDDRDRVGSRSRAFGHAASFWAALRCSALASVISARVTPNFLSVGNQTSLRNTPRSMPLCSRIF